MQQEAYPVGLTVDYPDRALDRVTTGFRIVVAIPIMIVLGAVSGGKAGAGGGDRGVVRDLVHRSLPTSDVRLRGGGYPLAEPVIAYAWVLVTDRYPPFQLSQ